MEVYVIRHPPVNVEKGICYGQLDVPCSPDNESLIEKIQQQLPPDIDKVYSSPLSRCKELTEKLHFSNIEIAASLKEMHFGEWEGMKWEDMNQEELLKWTENFVEMKAPSGENLLEVSMRVNQFMDELRTQSHKKVLIVTHGGVIRCIWAYLLNIPLYNVFKIPVGYGEIMTFQFSNDGKSDYITRLT